ncbi:MAG: hypothetical protein HYU36_02955 [Planctomycetes bacterium]|nr:hypothetical protein [Planctomycetota bacterium]
METLKISASTAPLHSPIPPERYPVFAKAGFLIQKGNLARELSRGFTDRGPIVEVAAEETVEAFCAIQVQR